MARYWGHCFWLVGWFGRCLPVLVSVCWITMQKQTLWELLTHRLHTHCAHSNQLTYTHHTHTHSHVSPSLTCIHSNLPNVSPRRQTRTEARGPETLRNGPWEEDLQVKQILWSNCSFSIAFVQYQLKKKTKKLKKLNFYFISQLSRWGQLYRSYRVNMALRHLIVGLPISFCK